MLKRISFPSFPVSSVTKIKQNKHYISMSLMPEHLRENLTLQQCFSVFLLLWTGNLKFKYVNNRFQPFFYYLVVFNPCASKSVATPKLIRSPEILSPNGLFIQRKPSSSHHFQMLHKFSKKSEVLFYTKNNVCSMFIHNSIQKPAKMQPKKQQAYQDCFSAFLF